MKGKIGDQPERVESQLLQLSPGLALAWAAGAVVHLQWDYLEDLHRHHQPSAHDLNYWNLLCLASCPCNTPGGNDHQVNRHVHWDKVWADFRPEQPSFFQTLVLNGSLSITTLSSWCAWLQCRDQRSTYLVRSIALSNLAFWGDGQDGRTMKSYMSKWKIIKIKSK